MEQGQVLPKIAKSPQSDVMVRSRKQVNDGVQSSYMTTQQTSQYGSHQRNGSTYTPPECVPIKSSRPQTRIVTCPTSQSASHMKDVTESLSPKSDITVPPIHRTHEEATMNTPPIHKLTEDGAPQRGVRNAKPRDECSSVNTVSSTHADYVAKGAAAENRQRILPKSQKDWTHDDYAYFTQCFNNSKSSREVKELLHGARNEKIVQICFKALIQGNKIDKEKVDTWFMCGGDARSRTPIVKVCEGDYIRISSALAERFDIKLTKGENYEFKVIEHDSKTCMLLIPL